MEVMNLAKLLQEPFALVPDIKFRIGSTTKDKASGLALAYLENRAIMKRLDDVCGPENWKNEFKEWRSKSTLCGISIKINGEWVTKWDGADESDFESTKGGLSDSMKRAAVQWGIGRYLYELDANMWCAIENGRFKDKNEPYRKIQKCYPRDKLGPIEVEPELPPEKPKTQKGLKCPKCDQLTVTHYPNATNYAPYRCVKGKDNQGCGAEFESKEHYENPKKFDERKERSEKIQRVNGAQQELRKLKAEDRFFAVLEKYKLTKEKWQHATYKQLDDLILELSIVYNEVKKEGK